MLIIQSVVAINPTAEPPRIETLSIAATVWDKVLCYIPTENLEEALMLALNIREEKAASFPISAPEIALAWKRKTAPEIKSSSEAWEIVRAEIKRKGWNGTPEFDDPLVAKVVRQLGWNFLCTSENAMTKFEWAWKEEAEIFREKVEIDPSHQLTESRRTLIPEVSGMFGQVAKRLESNPDDKPTPEEVREMFQNARVGVVSKRVN